MSVLFPKVNKPPTWDYRPIYYDPKKDEMDRKLAALQAKRAAEEQAKAAKDGKEEATKESATSAGSSFKRACTFSRIFIVRLQIANNGEGCYALSI